MSVLNPNSEEEPQECPLCLELLELDDVNFYPCSCGYQICRFCWNKIRTEGSGLCPACRSPYSENPADFKPLTAEELAKIKAEKRQKDQAKKLKISENRKHLANVRVVQKNLVFVVGLSPRLADCDVLKKPEYFGKFGKIHKVVINHSTSYAGNQNQGPSSSAYVTYYKSEDALRAIQAVNNIFIDGRTLKASLGTTKYCSHFMKNQTCPKHDCMYLHELGDEAASFTKEEMQQGKHTEYEKRLHEEMALETNLETTERSNGVSEKGKSRSPSPKAAWPNLDKSNNSFQNSYAERNGQDSERSEKSNKDEGSGIGGPDRLSPVPSNSYQIEANEKTDWNSQPSTCSASPELLDEDDLGFDPFHETQKAFSEMLENESKLVQNRSQATQRLESQQVPASNHAFMHNMSKPKPPPPGFNVAPTVHQNLPRFSGVGGLDALSNHMQNHQGFGMPAHHQQPNHLNPQFGKSSHFGSGPALRNTYGGGLNLPNAAPIWQGKEWQDGLRALLPHVNVSFGSLPNNNFAGSHSEVNKRGNLNLSQYTRDEDHLNSARHLHGGWNGLPANDWTKLDPAIVGGQLANHRGESPSSWIKTNLEQLASDTSGFSAKSTGSPILPGFSGLSLGSGNNPLRGNPSTANSHWDTHPQAGNISNAPPPGFAMNRGQIPFQNMSSMNSNSEGHQIEI